ncbi:MAG: hypothetical protein AAFQ82_18525, partial [Myxococcota bacterium]
MGFLSLNEHFGDESGRVRLSRDEAVRIGADFDGDGSISDLERAQVETSFDQLDTGGGSGPDGFLDARDVVDPGREFAENDLRVIQAVGHRAFDQAFQSVRGVEPGSL